MLRSFSIPRALPYARSLLGVPVQQTPSQSLPYSRTSGHFRISSRHSSVTPEGQALRSELKRPGGLLLKLLPSSVTRTAVEKQLERLQVSTVELEPGCALHVSDHAEIDMLMQGINDGMQTSRSEAFRPGLRLRNLPTHSDADAILQTLAPLGAVATDVSGALHAIIHCSSLDNLKTVCAGIEGQAIQERKVLYRAHKADDESYLVKVFNFGQNTSEQDVVQLCEAAGASKSSIQVVPAVQPTLSLRFSSQPVMKKAVELIQGLDANVTVEEQPNGRWHGVWFKNITNESEVKKVLEQFTPAGFVTMKTLSGTPTGNAVAYFNDLASAVKAVNALSDRAFGSKKMQTNYKPHVLPAIHVRNLPADVTVHDVQTLFRTYHPLSVELNEQTGDGDTRSATILLRAKRDETHAVKSKNGARIGDKRIKIDAATQFSPMMHIKNLTNGQDQIQQILSHLSASGVQVASSEVVSEEDVTVTFPTTWQARKALVSLRHGEVIPASGTDSGSLEVATVKLGAPTLQVFGLSGETSVNDLVDDLRGKSNVNMPIGLTASRTAFVKFNGTKQTKTAIHDLKQNGLEGQKINAQYYIPFADQETEYDESPEWFKTFDSDMIQFILHDNGDLDPATRYRLAVNHIEREFRDLANKEADPAVLATMPHEVRDKVRKNDPDGLLRLMLQNKDYQLFAQSLDEITHQTGLIPSGPEGDPWDLGNFTTKTWEDEEKFHGMLDELKQEIAEADRAHKRQNRQHVANDVLDTVDDEERDDLPEVNTFGDEDDESSSTDNMQGKIHVQDLGGDIKDIMALDPANVVDYDGRPLSESQRGESRPGESEMTIRDAQGRLWSGVVIKTGTTQKVVAGGRIMTYKSLVVIGNGQGGAGYGSGKGATPSDALESAFREALKNLHFIDVYDGHCLTHDISGKHNSCQVYIRALPGDKELKAGPIVEAILTRFGIASASAKVVGRRNAYSVVMATFKALSKHESLEEAAKKRGKRFLDVEWARKNKL